MNSEQQTYDENTCANIFLKWLGTQQGAEWAFKRAEEEFPELANRTRWEFVARRTHNKEEWIAIEVKSLVFSEGESQFNNWHNVVSDVNKRLEGKLSGKYWLAHLPKYTFDQRQRKMLVDCLKKAVQETAQALKKGTQKDISPNIVACFNHWPNDTRKQPSRIDPETLQLLYSPHPLLLLKSSNEGNSLRVGVGPVVGYWVEPTLKKALQDLLVGKGKANDQLGVAKRKGASKTVLLLDERIDDDPQAVAEVIRSLGISHLSNIDEVCLVSTFGGEHVKQVWSKVG